MYTYSNIHTNSHIHAFTHIHTNKNEYAHSDVYAHSEIQKPEEDEDSCFPLQVGLADSKLTGFTCLHPLSLVTGATGTPCLAF